MIINGLIAERNLSWKIIPGQIGGSKQHLIWLVIKTICLRVKPLISLLDSDCFHFQFQEHPYYDHQCTIYLLNFG